MLNRFCKAIMPSECTNILDFNQYKKSDEAQFIILLADFECLLAIINGCKNNLEINLQQK